MGDSSAGRSSWRGFCLRSTQCWPALTAWFSVRFLVKYFETNRLTPFAIYCFAAGLASSIYLLVK